MRSAAARIAVHQEEIALHERRIAELRRLISDVPPDGDTEPATVLAEGGCGKLTGAERRAADVFDQLGAQLRGMLGMDADPLGR